MSDPVALALIIFTAFMTGSLSCLIFCIYLLLRLIDELKRYMKEGDLPTTRSYLTDEEYLGRFARMFAQGVYNDDDES